MSQRQQIERIFEIDRQIRAGIYPNAEGIAKFLEVSRRVIFNDRDFMINRLGAPIAFDRQHRGWYYTDATWVLPNIMVNEGELIAFFLSVELAKRYIGTAYEESLRSAVEKISQTIKNPVSIDLETLRSHYTFAPPSLAAVNEHILLDLSFAIHQHRRVWMGYYTASRGEYSERTVSPYHLHNIQGDWYLIAFDDQRQNIRNFLVGRIRDWRILPETFQPDASFSIADWMQNAFRAERGEEQAPVAIRFDAQQAPYIRERTWHTPQEIEELPDGGLILRFSTAGTGEVMRWALQYGSHAEVLEPARLREMMAQTACGLAKMYA